VAVAQRTCYETLIAREAHRLCCFDACHIGDGISARRAVTNRCPIPRTLVALILFAGITRAQSGITPPFPTQSTVVRLTNAPSDKALKEIAVLLRAVTGSPYLSSNIAQSTIAITGTPEQLTLAEWLLKEVDKPADWRPSDSEYGNPTAREYKVPGASDELARVFYLRGTATPQGVQEILTILRTVADVQKLFSRSEPKMIAYRADPSQANLIEWLLPKLDNPSGDLTHSSDTFKVPAPARDGSDDILQVFYLKPPVSRAEFNRLLMALRTSVYIQKTFGTLSPPVLVVRGSSAQISESEQLIFRSTPRASQ
jgi:hypothetical protein